MSSEELSAALSYAAQMRSAQDLGSPVRSAAAYEEMQDVLHVVLTRVHCYIRDDADSALMRPAAAAAFELARSLSAPQDPLDEAAQLVKLGCYALLGDRRADFSGELTDPVIPANLLVAKDWGTRVRAVSLAMWLHLLRNRDRSDLIEAKKICLDLHASIDRCEKRYLDEARKRNDPLPSAYLVVYHNHIEVAEILVDYLTGDSTDAGADIRELMCAHFEHAEYAANLVRLIEAFNTTKILARAAQEIVASAEPQKARVGRTEMQMPVASLEAHAGKHHA